ncbi:MAG: hypothetical protein CVU65_09370 [Deltaproteobacteria bacterium HGW-Deltaproteobacteria-22]|nr:MAG: hypothetical protein CVU65_09370 [Deltaproteobacteria bacterium HGW-Deltaproteobacteria-22]
MHPRAPTRSGQPISEGSARVYHNSSALTWMGSSPTGEDNTTANRLSGYVGGGGLRVKTGDTSDLGLLFEMGSSRWTRAGADRAPSGPSGDQAPWALGVDFAYASRQYGRMWLAVSVEALWLWMPNAEYVASWCTAADGFLDCHQRGTDWNAGLGLALTLLPSWKFTDDFTLFAGLDLRMMPSFNDIIYVDTENPFATEYNPLDYDLNVAFGVGAELRLARACHLIFSVYQPVTRHPLTLGPMVGFVFSVDIGEPPGPPVVVSPAHQEER